MTPPSIHTEDDFFLGLAAIVEGIQSDFTRLIDADVAFDQQQEQPAGGTR